MSAIQHLVFCRLLVGLIFVFVATQTVQATCSSGKMPTFTIDAASLRERDIFNIRFKQIDIRGCKIWDVIVLLAEGIEKSSDGKRHFEVGLESSRTARYLDERVPPSRWDLGGPNTNLVGSNMTLEAIINTLCLQAGWSYDDHTRVGTMFTNSKRLPKPKR